MTHSAPRELASGNAMVARGALDAGCRFFSGYPITPSSEIYQVMMHELPRRGGLGLAASDEISALAYCVGASMAGYRAMTATSGPGFSLMIETIQYAVMTEIPVVVAFVQRLGPSTGGATQGGQGDVLLAEHCTSGGYTIPVLAPGDARQCYELTTWAFHWAERLRSPVVLLSDKEVGMTIEGIAPDGLRAHPVAARRPFVGAVPYVPYACDCPDEAPDFAPVGGASRVVATGSAHDPQGRLRKNAPEVLAILRRLEEKVRAHAEEMILVDAEPVENAETLVVSYGVSARAARQACRALRAKGRRVAFLQLLTLYPVPERQVLEAAKGCRHVVVVEENLSGLYAGVLEAAIGRERLVRHGGLGAPITPAELVARVEVLG